MFGSPSIVTSRTTTADVSCGERKVSVLEISVLLPAAAASLVFSDDLETDKAGAEVTLSFVHAPHGLGPWEGPQAL
jgi:hypothetical protein